jgi:hypothetical protein
VLNTYLVTLQNPSANPDEFEERYIDADGDKDAELQAAEMVASHIFDDVKLISVTLVEPQELYHEPTTT